jgi:hypothetical protein
MNRVRIELKLVGNSFAQFHDCDRLLIRSDNDDLPDPVLGEGHFVEPVQEVVKGPRLPAQPFPAPRRSRADDGCADQPNRSVVFGSCHKSCDEPTRVTT